MANTFLPSFAALQRRHASGPASSNRPDERDRLLDYLRQSGALVSSVADIHEAILSLPYEEELAAFRCREGVAVSHASDGWWLLFRDGDAIAPAQAQPAGAGGC